MDFQRGTFRVRGDVLEIFPAYTTDTMRSGWNFSEMRLTGSQEIDVLTGEIKAQSGAYGDFSGISLCGADGEDGECVQ